MITHACLLAIAVKAFRIANLLGHASRGETTLPCRTASSSLSERKRRFSLFRGMHVRRSLQCKANVRNCLAGSHSGVKLCRWTKSMLRGPGRLLQARLLRHRVPPLHGEPRPPWPAPTSASSAGGTTPTLVIFCSSLRACLIIRAGRALWICQVQPWKRSSNGGVRQGQPPAKQYKVPAHGATCQGSPGAIFGHARTRLSWAWVGDAPSPLYCGLLMSCRNILRIQKA